MDDPHILLKSNQNNAKPMLEQKKAQMNQQTQIFMQNDPAIELKYVKHPLNIDPQIDVENGRSKIDTNRPLVVQKPKKTRRR